jgi:hypothetical protein
LDAAIEAFRYRLLQVCHVLRQGKEGCGGIGSYALESFTFADGVLRWRLSMSNVRLDVENREVRIGGVVASLRYTAGGRVLIDSVGVDDITNLPSGVDAKAFSAKVERKSKAVIQNVIDSANGRP